MPTYIYKAASNSNQIVSGSLSAPSSQEVNQELQKLGLKPISIREEITFKASKSELPPVEKITFCRYVSTMLTSGLSLSEGMSVLKSETKHPVMRQVLNDILYHLERGQSLSTALALYPRIFDKFFIALVRAGEISGTMSESFKYLEEELRSEYSLSQKIKGVLMYPAVVFIAMLGIGGLMVFFIMPQIGRVFLNMTIPIPEVTKQIFRISIVISNFRIPIILSMLMSSITFGVFFSRPAGKKLLISLISPIPIIKGLLHQIDIARFCRIFSTLIASAVPIVDALDITLNSLSNPMYHKISKPIVNQVMEGKTIAQSFKDHNAFPPLLNQMIAGGERSGTLDKTLGDLATFYEEEVEESVKKSTQLLEPMLMLLVGVGVGGMILSIIAPMYSVVGSMSH